MSGNGNNFCLMHSPLFNPSL